MLSPKRCTLDVMAVEAGCWPHPLKAGYGLLSVTVHPPGMRPSTNGTFIFGKSYENTDKSKSKISCDVY